MWEDAYKFIYEHPHQLDLTYSRIKHPDNSLLEDMMPKYPTNIRRYFVFQCCCQLYYYLTVDGYCGAETAEIKQWLIISCKALVNDKLKKITITEIKNYKIGKQQKTDDQADSKTLYLFCINQIWIKNQKYFLLVIIPKLQRNPLLFLSMPSLKKWYQKSYKDIV